MSLDWRRARSIPQGNSMGLSDANLQLAIASTNGLSYTPNSDNISTHLVGWQVGRLRRLVDQQRSSGEMDPPQPAEPTPGKEGSKTSRKESARSSARSSGREKKSRDPSGRRRKNETEPEGPTPSEMRKWLDTYNQMKRELAARLAQDSVAENVRASHL